MRLRFILIPLLFVVTCFLPIDVSANTNINLNAPDKANIHVSVKDSSGDVNVTLNGETVMTEEGVFESGTGNEVQPEGVYEEANIDNLENFEDEVIEEREKTSLMSSIITSLERAFDSIVDFIRQVLG